MQEETLYTNVPEELQTKLYQLAEERGVSPQSFINVGIFIVANLPKEVWKQMQFRLDRCTRKLHPGQQLIEAICKDFRCNMPKWGRLDDEEIPLYGKAL